MYTVTYYPLNDLVRFDEGDNTSKRLNEHWNNGPSFCVRLWVFEMPLD